MRPEKRQGLTTGEVARMLGVSKRRVATLFDQGVLTGWKHPIVGWRSIDRESVEALTKKSKGWFRRGRLRKTTSRPSSENEIPPPNQGLTTREVAKMLGGVISQSTVIRYFDKGVLKGGRHTVVGWRLIDPKSVDALAKKLGIKLVLNKRSVDERK
jgi:hypothetical protein